MLQKAVETYERVTMSQLKKVRKYIFAIYKRQFILYTSK